MKSFITILTALCAAADAASLGHQPKVHHGVHSMYEFHDSDLKLQIMLPGYTGAAQTKMLSSNFTPSVHYHRRTADGGLEGLEDRDICARVTDCAGKAAESAVAWSKVGAVLVGNGCSSVANSVSSFLTDNDYAYARKVLYENVVLGLGVSIVATPIQYFINVLLDARYASSTNKNDVCGDSNPKTYAGNAASAIYEFCLAIQNEKSTVATTNYDVLDESSPSVPAGFEGLAKFYVASQASTWGPICHDMGIDWKARLLRRLGF